MHRLLPEYNTVENLVRVARIVLVIVLVLYVAALLLPLVLAAVTISPVVSISVENADNVMSSVAVGFAYTLLVPMFLPVVIPLIVTGVALAEVSDILGTMRRSLELLDLSLFESARRRLLLWGILTLLFSLVVPGVLLLIAYFKGEKVAEKMSELRTRLRY